jgi:hypothetical protein
MYINYKHIYKYFIFMKKIEQTHKLNIVQSTDLNMPGTIKYVPPFYLSSYARVATNVRSRTAKSSV